MLVLTQKVLLWRLLLLLAALKRLRCVELGGYKVPEDGQYNRGPNRDSRVSSSRMSNGVVPMCSGAPAMPHCRIWLAMSMH